jgi:DNA-binding response OmpR family regulator
MFLGAPRPVARSVGREAGPPQAQPPRIAVVDDDRVCLQLVQELLEDEGFEVSTFDDLRGAYEFIKASQPDLVILDLIQERKPLGLGVLAAVAEDARLRGLPLVVLSADALRLQHLERGLHDEGVAILSKPFDLQALVDLVRQALLRAGPLPTPFA